FNQPWMLKKFQMGQQCLFSGKPKFRMGRWEFSHPYVQWLEEEDTEGENGVIIPKYRLTEGLKAGELRFFIRQALESSLSDVADPMPSEWLGNRKLPGITQSLRGIHQPQSIEQYRLSRRRLVFDDLFEFQLGLALRRQARRKVEKAPVLTRTAKIDSRIRRLFPFDYTEGQTHAVKEIARDLASGIGMHRLVQADVGAGKTVVAIDTMLVAVAHRWQAVMMAPTELLATQHWETIDEALRESRVNRALLTGSLPNSERERVLRGLADGSIHLVVGTQALIQQGVKFRNLGVAVIDEQHKFGVAQRAAFVNEGCEESPHLLVMTATPIPRTLCLTQFGDLDVTLVKDRPAGRQSVATSRITGPAARRRAWEFLIQKLRSGRQLYVVCPLVEESDDAALVSTAAEEVYRELASQELSQFKVGLVHGRVPRDQRDRTMEDFRERELDVLVATTVVEVGVDVPNATLMVILDAERFGLSQLHQLRGRIARGKYRGYCFLFSESETPEAISRLSVLERTNDGFEVAEQDFELRGPGDILGTRQHGSLPLRFSTWIREEKLLEFARDEAFELVHSGELEKPEFAELKRRVFHRFDQLLELSRTG
ncbi:MAG: ATP-dependent DNA helicase RecG, partial [Planctomycetaceae bacterium]|nr:ATP-dependent DNA helicase RecG [Planctomycetaceae bacterium]